MPLTDLKVKNAKPTNRRRKVFDAEGLYIEISPKGVKTWKMQYRIGRKLRSISGGRYPDVSLADARIWKGEVKGQLRAGIDPGQKKFEAARVEKLEAQAETFRQVAVEWLEKHEDTLSARYHKWLGRRFEADVFPQIGSVQINEVDHADVLRLIRDFEKRGILEQGRKVLGYVARIMRYAVATQRAKYNPVPDVREAMKPRPRTKHFAKMPVSRLPEFYSKLSVAKCDEVTKLALRWTILTMVRTNETRFFRIEEIEGRGTDNPIWRISPDRMKMSREHVVPLPRQAVRLLDEIEAISLSSRSRWMFPQAFNNDRPISENCMLYALYDLGFKGAATVHGFRGLASTVLNEALTVKGERRFDKDWIELQLAHTEGDDSRAAYNSADYLGARRQMLQWWGDFLEDQEEFGRLL